MIKLVSEIFDWKGDLYMLKRAVRESHEPVIEEWKQYLHADTVLKKDGFIFFCKKIEEAKIIEDDTIDTNSSNSDNLCAVVDVNEVTSDSINDNESEMK